MRYLITFSYDGSKFQGFQRQKEVRSVQKTLEEALSRVLGTKIIIKGSGRTDSKVHALNQYAHFDSGKINLSKTKKQLNNILNNDLKVKKIKRVNEVFHARFSVKEKKYKYIINLNPTKRNDNYYFTTYHKLDFKKMQKASKELVGINDYENFVSGKRTSYITQIKKIRLKKQKHFIIMYFVGTAFYRYMIRHLAGALYDVGKGKLLISELHKLIAKENIKSTSVMPAYGLYLVNVKFFK